MDTARCAELFELCIDAEAAAQGIDIDDDNDDEDAEDPPEPELSQTVFVTAVQAYGYRIDTNGKWIRDHPRHTQYHVYQGQIVAMNVEEEIVEQRRRMSFVDVDVLY